jgi:hypothetical protein
MSEPSAVLDIIVIADLRMMGPTAVSRVWRTTEITPPDSDSRPEQLL